MFYSPKPAVGRLSPAFPSMAGAAAVPTGLGDGSVLTPSMKAGRKPGLKAVMVLS